MPTNEGMPAVFSASDWPSASISTVVKSLLSRTMVENDVRSSAAADSSAIEISRLHRISRVTGSKSVRAVMQPRHALHPPGGGGIGYSSAPRPTGAKGLHVTARAASRQDPPVDQP